MTIRESLDPDRSLWDLIAVELRRQREFHKLSGSRLAALFGCDRSTVSRYESGLLKLTERHAKIADREWGTEGLFARLVRFAKTGKDEDWFIGLIEYEARATRVKMWEVLVVSGLLQTPDYARALFAVNRVDDLDAAVERRMARQAAVFDRPNPPDITMILNWTVLEQPVAPPQIMRAQMARLLEVGERPGVNVRVLERGNAAHAGLDGSCTLLTVDDRDIAYADAPHGGRIIRHPHEVQAFSTRFDRIGDIATPVGPSRALIERVMESYT
jgi:transcriptional regulator with XRE-family HTH domain